MKLKIKKAPAEHPWKSEILQMLQATQAASTQLSQLTPERKAALLRDVAARLEKKTSVLLKENQKDLIRARKDGLGPALLDRLTLTLERVREMANGVRAVAKLPDPIGHVDAAWDRPNGLHISKVRVPIGVILMIYESRPNVTVECASLCLKSGNVAILRGGREAFYSNRALAQIFAESLEAFKISSAAVSLVQTTDRSAVDFLLKREKEIHLVIPRGGEQLIRKVVKLSRIPVIKHYKGICHVFVDEQADLGKASAIAFNAKMHRTGVCNAMETLLVHEKVAGRFLPMIGEKLKAAGCEVRGDAQVCKILPWARKAKAADYGYEFLDKILAVKVVPDLDAAIAHIQNFGSAHTDAIVTEHAGHAKTFKEKVDSSSVMVNVSTRFSDGFQYGFGAEIGISTDKIHARGPMGLEGLTSYKYIVEGSGQIRS